MKTFFIILETTAFISFAYRIATHSACGKKKLAIANVEALIWFLCFLVAKYT